MFMHGVIRLGVFRNYFGRPLETGEKYINEFQLYNNNCSAAVAL
jgi:hypothetical protein